MGGLRACAGALFAVPRRLLRWEEVCARLAVIPPAGVGVFGERWGVCEEDYVRLLFRGHDSDQRLPPTRRLSPWRCVPSFAVRLDETKVVNISRVSEQQRGEDGSWLSISHPLQRAPTNHRGGSSGAGGV